MNENAGYTIERGGQALLLLHDFGQWPGDLRPLADVLAGGGLTVSVPCLYEPGAHWSEWLRAARDAYTALLDAHVRVSVCALGESEPLALLLAEEYAPDALLLVPGERRPADAATRFALRTLERRARRGLYALDAVPRILLPESPSASGLRRARRLSRQLGACQIGEFHPGALADAVAAFQN
ncbi:MAG: hypothetical protein IJ822_05565 [Pyramidobacter sp.]|nr:hypothetical protein [Pyramidobacter sp.]